MEKIKFLKMRYALAVLFSLLVFVLNAAADASYWSDAQKVRDGVLYKVLDFTSPRLMKAWIMRVDLKTPGISFVTNERDKRWGERMPDYTNGVDIICTKRIKTTDFMVRKRKEGYNMIVAVNTAPWQPWCKPWDHKWGNPARWVVSHGKEICAGSTPGEGELFVIRKDGSAQITKRVPKSEWADVEHVHPGFEIIASNAVINVSDKPYNKGLHPRTVFGLSSCGRYLYLLVVDGRQPNYSIGASLAEAAQMMIDAGAREVLNMDGGGSATLVIYDEENRKPRMLNHQRHGERKVALSLGIAFKD